MTWAAMQNPLLYMLKTSHDEPHGVWTVIDYSAQWEGGAREGVFIDFHLQEYNFSCTLHLTHGLSFFFIALDFSMVWENNNGVLVLRSFDH
jgi:hypothetical protein